MKILSQIPAFMGNSDKVIILTLIIRTDGSITLLYPPKGYNIRMAGEMQGLFFIYSKGKK